MFAVLNDVAGINDDHDILDEIEVSIEDTQYDEYKDLLSELQVGLYPGCTKYSSLNFLVKLMHLKALYKWLNECMDAMSKLLKDAFPDGNKLPRCRSLPPVHRQHLRSTRRLFGVGLRHTSRIQDWSGPHNVA